MAKLTHEAREDICDLITHPGFKALMAELEAQVEAVESDVIKLFVGPENEKTLIYRKCRAEGARMLLTQFHQRLNNLKPKHDAKA